jgi:transposase
MRTKTRRSYTEAFKEEAVRVARESGHSVAQVAWNLGIADHLLYRWRAEQQQVEGRGQTRHSLQAEQVELAQLLHENAILKQERDFLRRAARSSRRSRDERPGNPGARPSLSNPLDVPCPRRLGSGLLRGAVMA